MYDWVGEDTNLAMLPTITFEDPWGANGINLKFRNSNTIVITFTDGAEGDKREHVRVIDIS